VHVAAAAVWVGGLAGLVLVRRTAAGHLPDAAQRFSTLALLAFVTLGGSGLLVALTRLSTSLEAWTSGYGALVAVKAGALVGLGFLGLAHRRRTLPRLAAGRSTAFVQLAGGELVLMAAATGVAAALSRTPVPPLPVPTEPLHGGGHSTLPSQIDPISLGELATEWRINAVLVLVLGLALAGYLSGADLLGAVATGFALAAAFLNAAFGFCLGCEVFLLVRRVAPAAQQHP
jgi:putative copper resistance protein D